MQQTARNLTKKSQNDLKIIKSHKKIHENSYDNDAAKNTLISKGHHITGKA
jgi:hypothetical protein